MKIKKILILITLLVFLACKNHTSVYDSPAKVDKEPHTAISKAQTLSLLDTTIVLSVTKGSHIANNNLSENKARTLLYTYFEKKGIKPRNESIDTSLYSKETPVIDYDTIYQIQTDKFSGAIVSYWLGPAGLNGHCFQPNKAIILNTKEGYKITNEEFIPNNYAIDSVINSTIHGYDYECGGQGVIRYLKVTLK